VPSHPPVPERAFDLVWLCLIGCLAIKLVGTAIAKRTRAGAGLRTSAAHALWDEIDNGRCREVRSTEELSIERMHVARGTAAQEGA
jgi:hypothetical protein